MQLCKYSLPPALRSTTILRPLPAHSNPPAIYNETFSLYAVPCNATPPTFSLDIGGKSFTMHPNDMFLPFSLGETCATSFTNGFEFGPAYEEGFYAIGAAFLHNVVAVFDVEGGGMHFAVHKY